MTGGNIHRVLVPWLLVAAVPFAWDTVNAFAVLGPNRYPAIHRSSSSSSSASSPSSVLSLSSSFSNDNTNSIFPDSRTDIRTLLTQRSIQSFVYLLNQCHEEHTVRWLEVRDTIQRYSARVAGHVLLRVACWLYSVFVSLSFVLCSYLTSLILFSIRFCGIPKQ